ncbi:MAG: DUF1178 family protein, partial [Deltaproteobacteria bacterium]|nr:DUF1178 family protein [Deltaproteobacteria bacterium]
MVVFDLTCINGHNFEGWFESLADLEKQIEDKILVCPICNEVSVCRRPSTFGLVKSRPQRQVKDTTPQQQDINQLTQAYE